MGRKNKKDNTIKQFDTVKNIRYIFAGLPEEYERSYELKLNDYAKRQNVYELIKIVENFRNLWENTSETNRNEKDFLKEEKIAYAAFYCLNIIYRRSVDNKLDQLIDDNNLWCSGHETFVHLNTMRCIQKGESNGIDPELLIQQEYKFALKYHNNAGYCHAFSDLYATLCESDEILAEKLIKQWGKRALTEVNHAIELDSHYAKYYCTKGRILALRGDYTEGVDMIRHAIYIEDPNSSGYTMRINTYQCYRLQIQGIYQVKEAKRQIDIETIREEINELKKSIVSNVEIIAFFAGVISFIIGSLSLAKDQTATDAALLIITLMGCLIAAFSAFGAMLHIHNENARKGIDWIVGGIGLLIAVAATFLTWRL